MARAIFLDRDGVINSAIVRKGVPYAPINLEEFVILPGVLDALVILKKLHFKLIVVTNQPDIKTGMQKIDTLNKMHQIIYDSLPIDKIMTCFHTDDDKCYCRKPKPGMLIDSAKMFQVNLKDSWMVGDRWRDIFAGQAAGCSCCYIDYNYKETKPKMPYLRQPSLIEFAKWLDKNLN
jgi:D-glycero-D-manno-heptose 1,7-bisphosphate phosphatase